MKIQSTLYMFLFLLIVSDVVAAMENGNKEIEIVKIDPEKIEDNINNITGENLLELKIKMFDDEDSLCTICLEPFEFSNGRFKTEVIDKKYAKDHQIHESNFHKKCITKWIKKTIVVQCVEQH